MKAFETVEDRVGPQGAAHKLIRRLSDVRIPKISFPCNWPLIDGGQDVGISAELDLLISLVLSSTRMMQEWLKGIIIMRSIATIASHGLYRYDGSN